MDVGHVLLLLQRNAAPVWHHTMPVKGASTPSVNALLSGLGFTVVLVTLLLQAKTIKDQGADLHKQRFESSFFELLRLLRELREQTHFTPSPAFVKSRTDGKAPASVKKLKNRYAVKRQDLEAFDYIIYEFVHWFSVHKDKSGVLKDDIISVYVNNIHKNSESVLSPYFRIIYTILNRIKNDSVLNYFEKSQYANLLRSQITSRELLLLSINALTPVSKDLFDFLCYFRMLKYFPEGPNRKAMEIIYPNIAFAARD